jgi:choline dehydrogenase-like flavoprotein
MGTTRMGVDPKNSVVNEDLALHGVPNCYVLSASVFPTGSNSNPTFTTLALASRLSEIDFFNKSN